MKWNNKGNELGIIWENRKIDTIYIYGAGCLGKEIYKEILFLNCKKIFIDRDEDKQTDGYLGEIVVEPNKIIEDPLKRRNAIIVVALSSNALSEVLNALEQNGFKENFEYFNLIYFKNRYLSIISAYCFEKSYLKASTVFMSTNCNLKCKNCSFAIPYLEEKQEFGVNEVIKDVDIFFDKVDFVSTFCITGGEPLLCKTENIIKILNYIGEHYRKNINCLIFLTNGTILLPDELLRSFEINDVTLQISDYTSTMPHLNDKMLKNKILLEKSDVKYYISKEQKWIDFGYLDNMEKNWSEDKLIVYFDECNTGCRGFRKGKFYYCYNSEMANMVFNFYNDNKNAIDFISRKKDTEFIRELAEFDIGYNEQGYINMCKRCNGYFTINKKFIQAGAQLN